MNSLSITESYPVFKKPNISKVFWIFIIGCVAGFFVESIWCLIKNGNIECRSSLILGPFTIVYGLGALVLYCGRHIATKNNSLHTFVFGSAAGTVMEYICSLFQETFFGSVSWDYSKMPFNIDGRVCLIYSVFWGLLAILWFKAIQPMFLKLISEIPSRIYKPLTMGLVVFFILNIVISIVAVSRWSMRLDGMPSINAITTVIDTLFPNEFMMKVYPNMLW